MKKLREKFYRYGYDPELGIVVDTSPDDIGEIAALAQYRAEDQGDCDIEALGIEMTTQDTIDRLNQQNTRIAELEAALSACLADVEWLNADDVRELIVEATLIGKTGHLKEEKEKLPEIEEGE